jgi:hypothetical protein
MMPSRTGTADLHMHTTASDGTLHVRDLLDFIATERADLDVIAITDHDTLDASLWAYERRHLYPFDVVPGVEVSTQSGHVLALWVTQPIPPHRTLAETTAAIHDAGGMAVLAHPFNIWMIREIFSDAWRYFRQPDVLLQAGIDGIEAHNAAIQGLGCNWLAAWLARRAGLPVISGSDAHTPGAVGSGRTYFRGSTADDLRRELRRLATEAKGTAWPIRDYIAYLKHEQQRRGTTSSGTINSSPIINR